MQIEDDEIGRSSRADCTASIPSVASFTGNPNSRALSGSVRGWLPYRPLPTLFSFVCPKGTVNVKRLPLPGSLSSQMRPPCSSTSRFVIGKPNPVPSRIPLVVSTTWWNLSKIDSCSWGGIRYRYRSRRFPRIRRGMIRQRGRDHPQA